MKVNENDKMKNLLRPIFEEKMKEINEDLIKKFVNEIKVFSQKGNSDLDNILEYIIEMYDEQYLTTDDEDEYISFLDSTFEKFENEINAENDYLIAMDNLDKIKTMDVNKLKDNLQEIVESVMYNIDVEYVGEFQKKEIERELNNIIRKRIK